ncbi:MAG: hypothetical protein DMG73_10260 [Acidobacteria bacterium]|nr:MAG: hypothetical protein DMG73_10260 [Acidobacteriota bacterium]
MEPEVGLPAAMSVTAHRISIASFVSVTA